MSGEQYYYLDGEHSLRALLQKIKAFFVPQSRTVNGHELSADVTIAPGDITGCSQVTKQTVTLGSGSWSSKQQTVTCTGVTATNTVIVSPAPANYLDWHKYKVRCTAQTSGRLTFATEGAPPNLTANVLIIDNTL